jgi:hypothetical protein
VAAPKSRKKARGGDAEIAAHQTRGPKIARAVRLYRCYFADRDPNWILLACDSLRSDGIEVPEQWLRLEEQAKTARRPRGHPAKAELIVTVLEDYKMALDLWGKPETTKYTSKDKWAEGGRLWRTEPEIRKWVRQKNGLTAGSLRLILHRYGKHILPSSAWRNLPDWVRKRTR